MTYTVKFATSPGRSLDKDKGKIDVVAPPGTFPGCAAGTVTDLTSHESANLAQCGAQVGAAHNQLMFAPGVTVKGGDQLEVVLIGLDNPPSPGPYRFFVGTSSNSLAPVVFRAAPRASVHGVSVLSLSTYLAAAREVTYTVKFTTSGDGALDATNGRIYIAGPAGMFPGCATVTLSDLTSHKSTPIVDCGALVPNHLNDQIDFPPGIPVTGGDLIEMVLTGIDNPASPGAHQLSVGTSSDAALTAGFQTVAGASLKALSVSRSTSALGATQVTYTIDFTTSPGSLVLAGTGTLDMHAPAGTFPSSSCLVGTIKDLTTATSAGVSDCGAHVGTAGAEVEFPAGIAIGGGDHVEVVLTKLDNPKAPGSDIFSVATSSNAARSVKL